MAKKIIKKKVEKEVKFPKYVSDVHDDTKPLTVDDAVRLLGWTEVDKEVEDFLLKDFNGNKIQCKHNVRNRPLYMTNVNDLKQTILTKRWRFNGEPIIVGKYGNVLNGQHTLIALILAEQERTGKDADKWNKLWKNKPCTITKVVVYGIDENDEVVNTMDTCKARSIPDIVYRNPYFAKLDSSARRAAARMAEHSIKLLWERTRTKEDPYAPRRTSDESLRFLDNHRHLVDCISWVHDQKREQVSLILSPGRMAGLLYLMSATLSDGEEYFKNSPHSEKHVNLECWDKAKEYCHALVNADPRVQKVRDAIKNLMESDEPGEQGGWQERIAIIIAGWLQFLKGKPIDSKLLKLEHAQKGEAFYMVDPPICGGIDRGPDLDHLKAKEDEQAEADDAQEPSPTLPKSPKAKANIKGDPTPEEIEEAKAEERRLREEEKAKGKGKGKGKGKAKSAAQVEQEAEAEAEEGEGEEGEEWTPPPSKADLKRKKAAPNGRLQPAGYVAPAVQEEEAEPEEQEEQEEQEEMESNQEEGDEVESSEESEDDGFGPDTDEEE